MTAVVDQISAAIKVDMDADPLTNFGYEFTTEESGGDWDTPLEDAGPPENANLLYVDLVAVNDEMTLHGMPAASGTRDIRHACTFQVVVRKRLDTTDRVETTGRLDMTVIRGLTELVQKICTYFVCRELSTLEEATWIEKPGDGIESLRYPTDLRENSQFTGIGRMSYEMVVSGTT